MSLNETSQAFTEYLEALAECNPNLTIDQLSQYASDTFDQYMSDPEDE